MEAMVKRFLLTGLLFTALFVVPMQADFFQCTAGNLCDGTINSDLMNGSPGQDNIHADAGNDVLFGHDGTDTLLGEDGDDLLFGGLTRDEVFGGPGNDTLLPGPDGPAGIQNSWGDDGNDTFIVLVGETILCQIVRGNDGFDVLHLIGFGPYIAEYPYGEAEPITNVSFILVQDPIAGGYIFIQVVDNVGNASIDRINGLSTPVLAVLPTGEVTDLLNQLCTV